MVLRDFLAIDFPSFSAILAYGVQYLFFNIFISIPFFGASKRMKRENSVYGKAIGAEQIVALMDTKILQRVYSPSPSGRPNSCRNEKRWRHDWAKWITKVCDRQSIFYGLFVWAFDALHVKVIHFDVMELTRGKEKSRRPAESKVRIPSVSLSVEPVGVMGSVKARVVMTPF